MADKSKRQPPGEQPSDAGTPEDHPAEGEPAVERGERIHTGKTVARGGQDAGHVPGATEQPAREDESGS